MKKYFLFLIIFFLSITYYNAQLKCDFNNAYNYLFSSKLLSKLKFDSILNLSNNSSLASKNISTTSYTIPVVFHVLHLGGSENISDAQIANAITCMNEDFQKLNADNVNVVPEFTALSADCEIKFVLASKDENGKCTNGITRHYTTLTNWTTNISSYIYTWNPQMYLNIYVVKSMGNGAAGYTFLPGTVSYAMDAIVVLNDYVGKIGTSTGYKSHTLSHEAGHWLNLQHVWGSNNNPGVACGDDGVSDTPITKGWQMCNLTNPIICTPGIKENVQNFMEYAYCSNMFTIGQKNRMHAALNSPIAGRDNISTATNLINTGVINPTLNCSPIAEYRSTTSVTCVGNTINFIDQSYNAPVNNWQWTSNLASNTSSNANGALTFTNSGIASIKLKVSNSIGADSISKTFFVVLSAPTNTTVGVTQSFEQGVFPNSNWIFTSPSFGGAFKTNTTTAATGTNCVWVNNYFDSPNEAVNIYSPAYVFNNLAPASLEFKYAYAQSQPGNNDKLSVLISTNCGTTWTTIFSKSGALLNSTGTTYSGAYTIPYPQEWQTVNIDISAFSNKAVYFKFEFTPDVNGPGNNVFIDDININGIQDAVGFKENLVQNNISLYPNPAKNTLTIEMKENISQLELFSVDGKLIETFKFNNDKNKETLELTNIKPGLYFAKINSKEIKKLLID
ncbi:M43 family zinc metalloprotease [Flavobacterium filum]|uniref:zinc-dependent metalloprotease n=1 Tax=Flavobacterium filum TaxID=370974 RepID=UPI0023F1FA17|nr:M43 family zinc metalloprotease [Flavobacterium filum]